MLTLLQDLVLIESQPYKQVSFADSWLDIASKFHQLEIQQQHNKL